MINRAIRFRLIFITALFFTLFCVISLNLYLLQIKKYSFFSNLGSHQYALTTTILPPRAPIYDLHGRLLATEKPMTSLFIVPSSIKKMDELTDFLKNHYPEAIPKLSAQKHSHFMYIARNITATEMAVLSENKPHDLFVLEEPGRYYPIPCLGTIIGKTNIDNNGISGIEFMCNQQLAGSSTTISLEKDARSGRYYFNKKTITAGVEGTPIHSTIDSILQFLVYEELNETITHYEALEGAVIIMDPYSGAIYSMVSIPDIDPNDSTIKDISLLKNRVVTETYEFGSVMKTFLALAALEEHIYQPDDIINCQNSKNGYVNGMKFTTWKAHGDLTFSEVIEVSNNIGTAKIAQKLGKKLYDHYRRCGFGQLTKLNFPGQQKGYITHPKNWSKASLNSLSFGYEIRATLLQLACAFSLFSNTSYVPEPYLIIDSNKKNKVPERLYSEETIMHMRNILEKTCTQGTGHAAHIPGITILGKTGTARLLDESGHYSPLKNIYTFSGIVEKGDYKRVIVTFIKQAKRHDLYASSVTAPLFERIAQKMLIHDNII